MMRWNMWWIVRFLFGQTVFLNCLTECQTSCLGFSICLLKCIKATKKMETTSDILSLVYIWLNMYKLDATRTRHSKVSARHIISTLMEY